MAHAAPSPKTPDQGRLGALDAFRYIAAAMVVWMHAAIGIPLTFHGDSGFAGRFAVPFFALTLVYLSVISIGSKPSLGFSEYAKARSRRLLIPFAAWSLVYLTIRFIRGGLPPLDFRLIFFGGSFQLWFLPFALVLSFGTFGLVRFCAAERAHAPRVAVLLAATGIAIGLIPRSSYFYQVLDRYDFSAWLIALPAGLWGFSLGVAHKWGYLSALRGRASYFWGGLGITGGSILASCWEQESFLLFNIGGFGFWLSALAAPDWRVFKQLNRLGNCAMGVYLCHVLFLGPVRQVGQALGFALTPFFALGSSVAILVASTLLYRTMRRLRAFKWLVV